MVLFVHQPLTQTPPAEAGQVLPRERALKLPFSMGRRGWGMKEILQEKSYPALTLSQFHLLAARNKAC